jgi:hypothetical protein
MVVAVATASVMASEGETDAAVDVPTGKPRRGKAKVSVRTVGPSFGNQKVVIVPKGDPRARGPAPPAPKPKPAAEPKIIVEAEAVEPQVPPPLPLPSTTPTTADGAATAPRPILKSALPSTASACLRNYNGAAVAARAASYQSTYKARGVKYSQPKREFGINAKYSDCSSFVTSILADTGFNCLFASGRYTAFMNQQIRVRGGYSQTAKVGDIVMWGSHTGLIVKQCSATTWSMVAMGNSGAGRAECKTVAGLKSWGSGGWLGFWTPRP